MNYNWNIWNWLHEAVPSKLRQTRMLQWLYAMLHPLRTLHSLFLSFRSAQRLEATKNSQVIVFEAAINTAGTGAGTLYVRDPEAQKELPVAWLTTEGQELPVAWLTSEVPPETLPVAWLTSEVSANIDFEVVYPQGYTPTAQLTATINKLKFAGTRWAYRDQSTI